VSVKRYKNKIRMTEQGPFDDLCEDADGDWIEYHAYAALESELAQVKQASIALCTAQQEHGVKLVQQNLALSRENESLRAALRDNQRFEWFFGSASKLPWVTTYMEGVKANWSVDQWRIAIDAALSPEGTQGE
jgi:hypothetical protein